MMTLARPPDEWDAETVTAPSGNSEPAGYRTGRWLVTADDGRHESVERFQDRRFALFFQEAILAGIVRSQQESGMTWDPDDLKDRYQMMRRMVWSLPLRPLEKLILVWVIQYSDPVDYEPPKDHAPCAGPKPDELAKWLCVSVSEVESALLSLEAYGYLDIERGSPTGWLMLTPQFDAIGSVFWQVEEGQS